MTPEERRAALIEEASRRGIPIRAGLGAQATTGATADRPLTDVERARARLGVVGDAIASPFVSAVTTPLGRNTIRDMRSRGAMEEPVDTAEEIVVTGERPTFLNRVGTALDDGFRAAGALAANPDVQAAARAPFEAMRYAARAPTRPLETAKEVGRFAVQDGPRMLAESPVGEIAEHIYIDPVRNAIAGEREADAAADRGDLAGTREGYRKATEGQLWTAANLAFGAVDVALLARSLRSAGGAARAPAALADDVFSPAAPSAARTVEEPTGSIADELLLIGPKTEGESPQLTAYRQMLEEERMAEIAAENAARDGKTQGGFGHANTLASRRALDEATLRNGGTINAPGALSDDFTREGNAAQGSPFNPVGARADNDLGPMGRLRATMTPEPRNLPRGPGALADESGAGLETASRQGRTNDNYGNWEPWFDGYTGGGAVPDSELNAANIESLRAQGAFTRQPPMSVSANPRPEVVAEGGAVTPPRPPGELQVHSPAPAAPYENVAMTYATGSPQERMAHVRDIVEQGVARARAEGLSEADAIARGEAEAIEYFRGFQDMRRPGDPFAFINKADIEAIQSGAYKAPASTIETVRPLPGNSGRLAPEDPEGVFAPAGRQREQNAGIARETSGTQREPLRSERINPWGYDTRAPNGTTAKAIGDYADGKPWDEIARSSGHSSADSAKNNVNLMLRTARARIAAGESPEAVAAAIGTDAATLNRALSTRRPDFRVDTDLDAAIREARKTKTVRETAEDLGVSIGMVQRAERRTRPDTTNVFTPLGFGATAGALALGAGEDAEAATPEETTFNVNPLPAAIRDGRWAGNPIKVPDVSGGYFVRDWTAPDGKTYRVLGQETADSNTLYFGTFEGEFPVARQVDYQGPAVGRQTPFPEGVPPYPFEPAGALAAPERREGYPLERFIGPAVGFAAARFGGPRVVRAVGGSAGDVMIMGRGAIPMAGAAAGGVTQAGLEGRPIEQGALEAAPFMALGPVEAAVRTTALRNMADQINTVSGRAARESAITAAGRQSRDVRAMDAAGAFPEGRDIGPFQVEDRLADFERSLRNRPSPQARVVTDELNANADEFDPDILAYYRNTQPEMLDGTPIPYDPVRSSDVLADTFQAQGWTAGPSGVFSPMQNQVRLMNAEEGARQRGALAIAPPQMEGARPVIPSGASPRPQPLTPGPSVAEPARGALAEEAPAQSMPSPISTDASVFEPTAQTPRAPKRVTPLETRLAKPDGARGDAATAFRGLSTDQLREAARVAGMEAEAAQITTAKELKEKLIPQLVRAARDSEDGASLIRDWRAAGLPLSILISLGIVSAGSGALSEDEPFAPAAR